MAKRKNASMPVMLVNPSKPRKKRRKNPTKRRKNPKKKRRSPKRRRNPRATKWGEAGASMALGSLSGVIAYGMHWGASYLPWRQMWVAAAYGGVGLTSSVLLAKYGDVRAGAGLAGGVGAILAGSVREILSAGRASKAVSGSTEAGRVHGRRAGAGALYERQAGPLHKEAGAVVNRRMLREAGAILGQRAQAMTMKNDEMSHDSFKRQEAGASRYVQGPVRLMGPRGWVNARYVSAHNVPMR